MDLSYTITTFKLAWGNYLLFPQGGAWAYLVVYPCVSPFAANALALLNCCIFRTIEEIDYADK